MLCLGWMLLAPKWSASAYISLPSISSGIILKSLVAT